MLKLKVPTDKKVEFVNKLSETGLRRIEVLKKINT